MSARLEKQKPLTEEMERCIRWMGARTDRSVHRHPGGIWSGTAPPDSFISVFGTSTVASLVGRGIAEYSRFQAGRNGDFPVKATLLAAATKDTQP